MSNDSKIASAMGRMQADGERDASLPREDFDERWLLPGSMVPIDWRATAALLAEVRRLRYQHEHLDAQLEAERRGTRSQSGEFPMVLATEDGLTPLGRMIDAIEQRAIKAEKELEALRSSTRRITIDVIAEYHRLLVREWEQAYGRPCSVPLPNDAEKAALLELAERLAAPEVHGIASATRESEK